MSALSQKPLSFLVATDLSARSDRALERALILARQLDAKLTVSHFMDPHLPNDSIRGLRDRALVEIAKQASAQPCPLSDIDVSVVIGNGPEGIVNLARTIDASVVILGVHRNESPELIGRTTAESVLRGGANSLLVVRTKPLYPYKKILIGVDFSETSRKAVEYTARLFSGCEFHLVHAFDVPFKAFLDTEDNRREAGREHQEQLEHFIQENALLSMLRHTEPSCLHWCERQGPAEQVLRDEAQKIGADLLVVGTHGRRAFAHAVFGSVAEALLARPSCDVLVVSSATH